MENAMVYLILGAGISGKGAYTLLAKKNQVFVYDDNKEKALLDTFWQDKKDVFIDLDKLSHSPLSKAILSPGFSPTHPAIASLKQRGVELLSELDLALDGYMGEIIAVTGTNGKSTVCAMISHVLTVNKIPHDLAGNIGISLCALKAEKNLENILVLEVSSYQLEQAKDFKVKAAAITSFSHDHIERHQNITSYLKTKSLVFSRDKDGINIIDESSLSALKEQNLLPLNYSVATKSEALKATKNQGLTRFLSSPNSLNAYICYLILEKTLSFSMAQVYLALQTFVELPFRNQKIGTLDKIILINDSKSTNVDSTLNALQYLDGKCLLLLGGQSKKEDFSPIASFAGKIALVICFGQDRKTIAQNLKTKDLDALQFSTLKEALTWILKNPLPESLSHILFSPGCASFDEFSNYQERGRFFNSMLAGQKPFCKG